MSILHILHFFNFFTKLIYPFLEICVQVLSGIFLCPEFVQFKISVIFMSSICPVNFVQNLSSIYYVQNLSSLYVQIPDIEIFSILHLIVFLNKFRTYSNTAGQIPDISITFSGHFFFIGLLCNRCDVNIWPLSNVQ